MANQQPIEIISTPWLIERSGMDLLLLTKTLLLLVVALRQLKNQVIAIILILNLHICVLK